MAALTEKGRYTFTLARAIEATGLAAPAAKMALKRLSDQQQIVSPARGFYVSIPPEYRALGSLPAEQFIPDLMAHWDLTYYVGLLSAAERYRPLHHRLQQYQVMLEKNRREISCGKVRVTFHARKNISVVDVQKHNTPRGVILVATPEVTALDLVGYHQHAGGMDNVATVLADLAESLDPEKLTMAAAAVPVPWVQRLGYLLELVGEREKAVPLKSYLQGRVHQFAQLMPGMTGSGYARDDVWKLNINVSVEPEL